MANKNFKVKNSITIPEPLALTEGGTGQTSATNALNALLPSQAGNSNKVLSTDGTNTTWVTPTSSYTPMTSTAVSSNITLSSNNKYFVDTTSSRTLTLPSSPSLGDEVYIFDASNTALTNNITVLPNSNKIQGSVQNLIIDSNSAAVYLAYTGSSYGWDVN
jgi:hypothetical protein